ncbi:hypothetical protein RRG08_036472 [Elysia crispata]|uniref:Uncharacterized protein n=1 Tax=Elysia crispata TaxID=231223 RepID=A0AAE0ZKL8_9GAST|nr:hypothetical protein RRG08_036472 [Elysia crispata]
MVIRFAGLLTLKIYCPGRDNVASLPSCFTALADIAQPRAPGQVIWRASWSFCISPDQEGAHFNGSSRRMWAGLNKRSLLLTLLLKFSRKENHFFPLRAGKSRTPGVLKLTMVVTRQVRLMSDYDRHNLGGAWKRCRTGLEGMNRKRKKNQRKLEGKNKTVVLSLEPVIASAS